MTKDRLNYQSNSQIYLFNEIELLFAMKTKKFLEIM